MATTQPASTELQQKVLALLATGNEVLPDDARTSVICKQLAALGFVDCRHLLLADNCDRVIGMSMAYRINAQGRAALAGGRE